VAGSALFHGTAIRSVTGILLKADMFQHWRVRLLLANNGHYLGLFCRLEDSN
jgi:hypothetical protein